MSKFNAYEKLCELVSTLHGRAMVNATFSLHGHPTAINDRLDYLPEGAVVVAINQPQSQEWNFNPASEDCILKYKKDGEIQISPMSIEELKTKPLEFFRPDLKEQIFNVQINEIKDLMLQIVKNTTPKEVIVQIPNSPESKIPEHLLQPGQAVIVQGDPVDLLGPISKNSVEVNDSLAEVILNELKDHLRQGQTVSLIYPGGTLTYTPESVAADNAKYAAEDEVKAEPYPSTIPKIVDHSLRHVLHRAEAYDSEGGERSMSRTVQAFNAFTGHNLSEADGWRFMQCVKGVRLYTNRENTHLDSMEDGIAYSALEAECIVNKGLKDF